MLPIRLDSRRVSQTFKTEEVNSIVKIFYDLETTGLNPKIHSIHQIAGMVEVNGSVVERFNLKVQPHPKAQIDPRALRIGGVTEEQIMGYPPMIEVYRAFVKILEKYIDVGDRNDGAYLAGFNNRKFDDIFLLAWFIQNGSSIFFGWFRTESLDVEILAAEYLLERRRDMPSFKLKRVAVELGLQVDKDRLHDGAYDVELTRDIYNIVTGRDIEL